MLLALGLGAGLAGAAEIPRGPLDALWEEHMLAGTDGMYEDGTRLTVPREHDFESADGQPGVVWPTKYGIRVQDFRETRLGGLLSKGGWRIEGGLLARGKERAATIELYGKSVWRVEPALFHFGKAPPRSAQHSYDFFLLYRPDGVAQATIVKKWTILPDQIPYNYYLRGRLEYEPVARVATLRVTGVEDNRLFLEERVDLSQLVAK